MRSGVTARHTEDGEVYVLVFSSRKKLIYKPRSAATDIALADILRWLNTASSDLLPMRSVTVLDRGEYSWHVFVPYRACKSDTEVSQYYQRVGQFAALLQILGSTDYHFGNLIADGADPVLVDNETLFSPFMCVDSDFTFTGDKHLDEGVLHALSRSHFLLDTRQLIYRNAPSIVGVFEDKDRLRTVGYRHVNTDAMIQRRTYATWKGNNIPKLGRIKVDPYHYVQDMRAGYARALHHFNANREALYEKVKTVTDNFNIHVRLLIRPTAYYEQLASRVLKPGSLRDGITRSLVFEEMALFYVRSEATADSSDLLQRELEMMEHQLIPWFDIGMNGTRHVETSNPQETASVIRYSAQSIFEANLQHLNSAFIASNTGMMGHLCTPQKAIPYQRHAQQEILEDVIDLADHLHLCYSHCYPLEELQTAASEIQLGVLGRFTVGEGLGGMLLLFAAMEQVQGSGKYHSTIKEFLAPLFAYLSSTGTDNLPVDIGYGALDGLGSIIYTLTTISQILQDNTYRDLALRVAAGTHLNGPETIQDISLGHGISGYLMSLIKLDRLCPDGRLASRIHDLAKTLLRSLTEQHDEERFGYMTGMTGALYTLCQLYLRQPDQELQQHVSVLYTQLEDHWSDKLLLPSHAKTQPGTLSLDHGLAGWYLTQHAAAQIPGLNVDLDSLKRNASKLLSIQGMEADQISTGLAGRCEPALKMRTKLSQDLLDFTTEWSTRYQKLQRHLLTPRYLTPLFYEGTAGILYQQLRLINKHQLPSIIAFE
jgi:type 2 lantibiotic biosynthesis protein LanM